ncbi:MAG TPA: hypothetical protein VFV50_07630, partial [Bdellovibrionales bacterium]|nr:hypothetical protein [Bdellovibrionales bacterium]
MLKILIVLASLSVATADTANAQYRGSAYDPEPMSFDSLKTTIESKRLTALEQVLAALTPEYRSEFVLMYSSRSVQDASFQNPRVIFFGSDASFITAFNGDPMQRGYDRLEIIQFRKSQRRFEFREIVFRKGQAPEISRPNPPKCLICHQSPARMDVDPRPNWEPYNRWPGAYEKLYRLANYEKDAIQAMPASVNHLKPVLLS